MSFSPSAHPLSPLIDVPSFDIRNLPDSPGIKFFDKFKHPDYQTRSAFRLLQPLNSKYNFSNPKKQEIIRKHRGNYRKYTVAEKEEAVKQVFLPSLRFWRVLMPRKSQKNTVFHVGTCSAGRKTAVNAKKEADGRPTARCNSPSTQKLMAKY